MALEVIMPKAGVDMTEGQIVQWNKKVGEFVKEGEILLEIMTDKVSMELEAEEDGYLIAILKGDGETVPVTEVIGYLGEEAELINEASSIIEMEITVEEMLKTIHGHPTYSEVMYEAFADVLGMAIHSPKKK